MSILVIESQSFPCVDYFKRVIKSKHVKIEQFDAFQKMSFRNRYVIAGANGLVNLTIPVVGGREQKSLIQEVEIDYSNDWPTKHWRTIVSSYSKSPFFDYYAKQIEKLLFSNEKKLFTFNVNIIIFLFNALKINALLDFTTDFIRIYEGSEDCRGLFLPKNFQKDTEDWKPKYAQVFEDRLGFQSNLSILDLLFCEGPNTIHLLHSTIK